MPKTPLNPHNKIWFSTYIIVDLCIMAVMLATILKPVISDTPIQKNLAQIIIPGVMILLCALDAWMMHFRNRFFISINMVPLATLGVLFIVVWFIHPTGFIWLLPLMIVLFMRMPLGVATVLSAISIVISLSILKWHWDIDIELLARGGLAAALTLLGLSLFIKINRSVMVQLNETTNLLNNALQTMSQGIAVIGKDGRFSLFNDKLCEILDLPKELIASRPLLSKVVQFQTNRGDFGQDLVNVQDIAREHVRALGVSQEAATPTRYLRVDQNGRHIEVQTHTMPSGDVVRTYTDVTEYESVNRRLQKAITENELLSLGALAQTREKMVAALTQLSLIRDNETGLHIQRTQLYCRALAESLVQRGCYTPELSDKHIDIIVMAAPMHDLGKIGIPDHILLKPGRHTAEESTLMRTHTTLGESILRVAAEENNENDSLFVVASNIAGGHHENWDGSGYPRGLKAHAIPLDARIMALADVYDALTSVRIYKASWTHEQAATEIVALSGVKFDPIIVDAFKQQEEKFRAIAIELADMIPKA